MQSNLFCAAASKSHFSSAGGAERARRGRASRKISCSLKGMQSTLESGESTLKWTCRGIPLLSFLNGAQAS